MKRKKPIVFGSGRRSSGVTKGQTGNLVYSIYQDKQHACCLYAFHTYHLGAVYEEKELYHLCWRVKGYLLSPKSDSVNIGSTLSQDMKHL